MRRDARTDGNHRELLDLARRLGGFVIDTSQLGEGKPDAFVWCRVKWLAVEIKSARGHLTTAQRTLHAMVPIAIWRTREDVLQAFWVQK